jgi:hypothetical protein
MKNTIWQFNTRNFCVQFNARPEEPRVLDWDEDGSIARDLESGEFCAFVAEVRVLFHGIEIGADYLGGCIYKTPEDFRDHLGVRQYELKLSEELGEPVAVGSYFSDMVREAIREARENMGRIKEAA